MDNNEKAGIAYLADAVFGIWDGKPTEKIQISTLELVTSYWNTSVCYVYLFEKYLGTFLGYHGLPLG